MNSFVGVISTYILTATKSKTDDDKTELLLGDLMAASPPTDSNTTDAQPLVASNTQPAEKPSSQLPTSKPVTPSAKKSAEPPKKTGNPLDDAMFMQLFPEPVKTSPKKSLLDLQSQTSPKKNVTPVMTRRDSKSAENGGLSLAVVDDALSLPYLDIFYSTDYGLV